MSTGTYMNEIPFLKKPAEFPAACCYVEAMVVGRASPSSGAKNK